LMVFGLLYLPASRRVSPISGIASLFIHLIRSSDVPNYTMKADFVRTPPSRSPHFGSPWRGWSQPDHVDRRLFHHFHPPQHSGPSHPNAEPDSDETQEPRRWWFWRYAERLKGQYPNPAKPEPKSLTRKRSQTERAFRAEKSLSSVQGFRGLGPSPSCCFLLCKFYHRCHQHTKQLRRGTLQIQLKLSTCNLAIPDFGSLSPGILDAKQARFASKLGSQTTF